MNPMKSTTSAKTINSNSALTPILRSGRGRNGNIDSEDPRDHQFTHTEFTETVNDDDDDNDDNGDMLDHNNNGQET